ncbi:acetylxylan esterase [Dyadobacter sp. CY326]|uniref:glucuronyl esterase domain-containing protein n=1 Tax=Dyadobacter sp. CY326 TaxID=2907300 RepID=UPI001F204F09|nr:acetylxylan esterase [Dyadobacter sp. CY326]MCE7066403.1 acetylxylan esterase [Dyadobacter sp. CY326]
MKSFLTALTCVLVFAHAEAQNYDESKVPAYTLPQILKTEDGKAVKNRKAWEETRRPEILRLFENNVYGQLPQTYDSISYAVTEASKTAMDGRATLKEVVIKVFKNKKPVTINLTLFVPKQAKNPVAAFVLINNRGKDNTDPARKTKSEFWPAEMVIDSGYAIAAFHVSDLAPDDKDNFMTGVLQLYPEQLTTDNGMRAIGAWAWGASRVMDYFETDKDIDSKKVTVVGHSRGGKASLWAAAQDERFAMCVTNCSGNTGAALARRQFGERISRINTTFPHWFSNNYKKFMDQENQLPVDQHMLIALIAPRPIYATNASKDLWADPTGTFLALKAAEQTYGLYNLKSNLPTKPPGINEPIYKSIIAYHNREGEHDMTLFDWGNFVKFANYHFKK